MHRCSDRRIYQRKSATSFGTPSCTEGCFPRHYCRRTHHPILLHDLVNFIADIQQLHATRGSALDIRASNLSLRSINSIADSGQPLPPLSGLLPTDQRWRAAPLTSSSFSSNVRQPEGLQSLPGHCPGVTDLRHVSALYIHHVIEIFNGFYASASASSNRFIRLCAGRFRLSNSPTSRLQCIDHALHHFSVPAPRKRNIGESF